MRTFFCKLRKINDYLTLIKIFCNRNKIHKFKYLQANLLWNYTYINNYQTYIHAQINIVYRTFHIFYKKKNNESIICNKFSYYI